MSLLNFVKSVFSRREGIHVCFKEMIVVIEPHASVVLYTEDESDTIVTGFAGTIWVQVEDREFGNTVKHGETLTVPGTGKITLSAMTENVPCKIHVNYKPRENYVH